MKQQGAGAGVDVVAVSSCPYGKRQIPHERLAREILARMRYRHEAVPLTSYRCVACGSWHIGRNTPGLRASERARSERAKSSQVRTRRLVGPRWWEQIVEPSQEEEIDEPQW